MLFPGLERWHSHKTVFHWWKHHYKPDSRSALSWVDFNKRIYFPSLSRFPSVSLGRKRNLCWKCTRNPSWHVNWCQAVCARLWIDLFLQQQHQVTSVKTLPKLGIDRCCCWSRETVPDLPVQNTKLLSRISQYLLRHICFCFIKKNASCPLGSTERKPVKRK